MQKSPIVKSLDLIPAFLASRLHSKAALTRVIRPLVNRLLPVEPTPISVRSGLASGLKLPIYARSEKYYWTGTHEPWVQRAIADHLEEGMSFWDVGAHIGLFSLLASRLVGQDGCVTAFEPVPDNFARLQTSIALNSANNIHALQIAVAAISGEAYLYAHGSSLMWTLKSELTRSPHHVATSTITLDELCIAHPIPNVLKIDVEGAEVDVLRGGLNLFAMAKPVIIAEFTNDVVLSEGRALLPFYSFSRLSEHHWLLR